MARTATIIDGPFAATSELVAGFWLWEVKDMEEARRLGEALPKSHARPSEIEIRPFYEMSDLAGAT